MAARRRAKGDGALFKRSDGMWLGSLELPTTDGKRRRKTVSSRDYNTALAKLRQLRKDIDAGQIPTTAVTTVAKWLDHWLENIHAPTIRPTTYTFYEKAIRLYVNPQIGGKRLDRLTPEDVRQMHRSVQKGHSTRAAQKAHQVLQRALRDAVNEGVLVRNVAAVVAKPKHTMKPQEAFSFDVAQHIIGTAIELDTSSDVKLASRWAAAFFTGARQGELLGLTWDHVDLQAGEMQLEWQLQQLRQEHGCGGTCGKTRPGYCPQRTWKVPAGFEMVPCYLSLAWTRPKTKAGTRVVDIMPPLLARLRDQYAAEDFTINHHRLVWHDSDGHPISPKEDYTAWKKLLAAANVPDSPLHSIRHSTASLLQQAGVDEQVRMKIMGQSSFAAHRGYVHIPRTQERLALANLNPLMP